MQPLLRDSVLAVLAGQLPDDEGLVPGAGQDHVGVLGVGGDLGDPSIVAREGSAQSHVLTHLEEVVCTWIFGEEIRLLREKSPIFDDTLPEKGSLEGFILLVFI